MAHMGSARIDKDGMAAKVTGLQIVIDTRLTASGINQIPKTQ